MEAQKNWCTFFLITERAELWAQTICVPGDLWGASNEFGRA
jgi:hypothetical protein